MGHRINQKEILEILEMNEDENTTFENLRDMRKVVSGGNFITIGGYIRKLEIQNINDWTITQASRKTEIQ